MKILILFCVFYSVKGFYLPGIAPVDYCEKASSKENCRVSIGISTATTK